MQETIKIISISTVDKSHLDNPYYQDFIEALNEGGQTVELTRFYSPGEPKLTVGSYYKGKIDTPKKAGNRHKFTLISPMTEFNGIETPFHEEPKSMGIDDRQRLIILQSLLRDISIKYQSAEISFLELLDELEPAYVRFMEIAEKVR